MEIFISILIIVYAILNIILFFKIWGATNNIKKLTEHFTENKNTDSFLFLYSTKDKDAIFKKLNIQVFNELRKIALFGSIRTEKGFIEQKEYLLNNTYKKYYTAIEKEIQNEFYNISYKQIYNIDNAEEIFIQK